MSANEAKLVTAESVDSPPSVQQGTSTMVWVYAVIIVILVIIMIWSSQDDEKFVTKNTRSDLQGDWDLLSELAVVDKVQENVLRKVNRLNNRA